MKKYNRNRIISGSVAMRSFSKHHLFQRTDHQLYHRTDNNIIIIAFPVLMYLTLIINLMFFKGLVSSLPFAFDFKVKGSDVINLTAIIQ